MQNRCFFNVLRKIKQRVVRLGERGYILMLHRVSEQDENGITLNENMKVSPSFLDAFIAKLRCDYNIIGINDIPAYLKQKTKQKFIVFTFDDGYRDNLINALPIFERYGIPFTIFITSCFPNRNALLWWYSIADILLHHEKVVLSDGVIYDCSTYEKRNMAFEQIRSKVLSFNQLTLKDNLNSLFSDYNIDWSVYCDELCLSWNEIRSLTEHPLVTIGAHTAHHYNLKELLSVTDVEHEIKECIVDFQKNIQYTPFVFAYPFGSPKEIGKREIGIVSQMEFSSACVGYGYGVKTNSNPYELPRIAVLQNNIEAVLYE